jgi:O-antigen ligase
VFVFSQSRWAYVALLVCGAVSIRRWLTGGSSYARKVVIGAGSILAACAVLGVALAAYTTGSPVGQVMETVEDSIIRDPETVRTASGRVTIFSVLWNEAVKFPFGMGYAAGPRLFLQRSGDALSEDGIFAGGIGEAHNMYLEVLSGMGFGGLASWLIFLACLVSRCHRIPFEKRFLPQVLLVCSLVQGLVCSGGALPLTQASALLWIATAILWPASNRSAACNRVPVLIMEPA